MKRRSYAEVTSDIESNSNDSCCDAATTKFRRFDQQAVHERGFPNANSQNNIKHLRLYKSLTCTANVMVRNFAKETFKQDFHNYISKNKHTLYHMLNAENTQPCFCGGCSECSSKQPAKDNSRLFLKLYAKNKADHPNTDKKCYCCYEPNKISIDDLDLVEIFSLMQPLNITNDAKGALQEVVNIRNTVMHAPKMFHDKYLDSLWDDYESALLRLEGSNKSAKKSIIRDKMENFTDEEI